MRESRQKHGSGNSRADAENGRGLVKFGDRAIQKSGYSRTIPLPKQALKNLDVASGDSLEVLIHSDRDELVLRPTEEGD